MKARDRRAQRLRWVAVLAVPTLLVAGSALAGTRLQKDERRTVDATGKTGIVITNNRGQTVVVGKQGIPQVTIVVSKVVKAGDRGEAQRLMDALGFDVSDDDGDVVVKTITPEITVEHRGLLGLFKGETKSASIDYTVEVPQRFSVVTLTTAGDVRVSNITGTGRVQATSGDVTLREIKGGATVDVTSGTVEVTNLGGDLRVTASSGNLTINRVDGKVSVQTTAGDVTAQRVGGDSRFVLTTGDLHLDGCLGDVTCETKTGDAVIAGVQGSVNARSATGDLVVEILPLGQKDFVLSSATGDIDVHYLTPREYGFHLDVATSTGTIQGDLPIKLDAISRQRLKGIVGSGASRVIIETASGDVSIAEKAHGMPAGVRAPKPPKAPKAPEKPKSPQPR